MRVDYSPDKRTTRTSKFSDLSAARREIREMGRRFLKRCEKLGLVSNDQVIEYAGNLSINLPL